MKLSQKILISVGLVAVIAGVFLYVNRDRCDTKRMLTQIADEGYETAQDVLFPGKNIQGKHLKFGPVIPE